MVLWPAIAAAIVFASTLRNGFVYDDPIVLEWLKTRSWDLEGFLLETRGLTYAVHAMDDWIWGSWAGGYHLTNILLHCAACSLSAFTAWTLSRSRLVGLLTGLFFAVHPVHVEVVANIANRKDMLALIFALLGLLAWRGIDNKPGRIALTTLCYALALYSKEVAAAGLVVMLFIGDLWLPPERRNTRAPDGGRSLRQLAPLLVGGLVAASIFSADLLTYFSQESIRRMSDGHYHTLGASLATSAGNLAQFLRLLVFPNFLSIDYPLRPQSSLLDRQALMGLGLVALWLILTVRVHKHSRTGSFALTWIAVMFLPCSNIIPLHHIHVAERYLYAPSFGFCLALALGLRALVDARPNRSRIVLSATGLLLLVAGARSFVRNDDWRDVPALVAAADRDGVDTWRVHKTAASWALRNDDPRTAARRYARAAELRPGDPDLQFWKAVSATHIGDFPSAITAGRATVALRPNNANAHYNLGLALIQVQDLEAASEQLEKTTELEPDYAPAHYNLAVALSLLGQEVRSLAAFERCIALDPDHAEAHFNLGAIRAQQGLEESALVSMRRAVSLAPQNARFLEHLFSTSLAMNRTHHAIQAGEVLTDLQPERADVFDQLGDLYLKIDDLARAVGAYRRAVALAPDDLRQLEKLADACIEAEKLDWAESAYAKILKLQPDHARARAALEALRQ